MKRNQEIYKVTLVGGVVNVVLLLFKFVAGIVGHSAAMVADAVHSLSDFVTDVIVLVFIHISGKPKDKSHDYGHGKYETLALTLIGVALLIVAIGILYSGALGGSVVGLIERSRVSVFDGEGPSAELPGGCCQCVASS